MNGLTLLLVVYPIFISPVAMWLIRETLERGQPAGIFNPKTQSWAFLFGDTFSLPLTILFALRALENSGRESDLVGRWWWVILSVIVGGLASLGFRKMDSAGYAASGHADRLNSPTKQWHDYVVYSTVGFLLVLVAVPAVLTRTADGWWTLAFFGTWVLFGICDIIRGLDPAKMHPRVQDI